MSKQEIERAVDSVLGEQDHDRIDFGVTDFDDRDNIPMVYNVSISDTGGTQPELAEAFRLLLGLPNVYTTDYDTGNVFFIDQDALTSYTRKLDAAGIGYSVEEEYNDDVVRDIEAGKTYFPDWL